MSQGNHSDPDPEKGFGNLHLSGNDGRPIKSQVARDSCHHHLGRVAYAGLTMAADPETSAPPEGTTTPAFAGDRKTGQSVLGPAERRFIDWAVPKIPEPIGSHQLTMLTLVWSVLMVVFGLLAVDRPAWLHAMSVLVFLQWLTDSLDGSLGKYRKQGLVKWGFFADHLLDLLFAGSIVIAYSFMVEVWWLRLCFLVLLLITCATMAVSFLSFAATNRFQIAYYGIGPTEIRIAYIALNTLVFFVGTAVFSWGVPVVLAVNVAAFLVLAVQTSNQLWRIDYEANVDNAPR